MGVEERERLLLVSCAEGVVFLAGSPEEEEGGELRENDDVAIDLFVLRIRRGLCGCCCWHEIRRTSCWLGWGGGNVGM